MKTLDEIIKDFCDSDVMGEGEVQTGGGAYVTDFDTYYYTKNDDEPANFVQEGIPYGEYQVDFDANYQTVAFSATQLRFHDLTPRISAMQDILKGLLLHDPRWVFANYGQNITKVNNNLYTVEVERVTVPGKLLPDIVKVVEFHVSDDEILTKLRSVTSAERNGMSTETAVSEINFVY